MDLFLKFFVGIVGMSMSLAYIPQSYHLYRTKSYKDISVLSYSVFAIGTSLLLIYGIYQKDIVLILSFLIGVPGAWSVLLQVLWYRRKYKLTQV